MKDIVEIATEHQDKGISNTAADALREDFNKHGESSVGKPQSVNLDPIARLNLPAALDLNHDFVIHTNPAEFRSPCVVTKVISHQKTPLFIPEGKDAVNVYLYGLQANGRLGMEVIYFTPNDGKLYVLDNTTDPNHPKVFNAKVTHMDRSGGATLEFDDGTKILKHPDFHPPRQGNVNDGYTFKVLGYTVDFFKGKPPSSSYNGPDLNAAHKAGK